MLDKFLETQSLSLVLIGKFNPVIVTPPWLVLKGLIREEEAENARIDVIHRDIVQFELDWLTLKITPERFEIRTSKTPYFDVLRDLVKSILLLLKETPIEFLGLNHIFELKMPNKDIYYKFGAKLTDLSLWNEELNDPRMMTLEIIEENRKDGIKGKRRIRISPTGLKLKFGVAVDINDHIVIEGRAEDAAHSLVTYWDDSFRQSQKITSQFLKKLDI